ncbi:Clp protease ClpP [Aerococcaceae bacterium NML210727]|nr:Clp protease ClpP [Aerococcaceae bacterium NML210727]MCW6655078.1 Clp protease ClpP [Aerococcaceae bacterium NML201296]
MSKRRNVPFNISNELTDTRQVLTLSGTVRKKYWEDDQVVDEQTVRAALAESNVPLTIRLNSPGGDVFEGISIYNLLKDSERDITVEVTALAASAASIIAMGADKVIMCKGSSLMIHEATSLAYGNKADIRKVLNALETIDDSLVSIYVERTGNTVDQINDWLNEEKWFTAEEAVKNGFAHEVKDSIVDNVVKIDVLNLETVKDTLEKLKNEVEILKNSNGGASEESSNKIKIFGGKRKYGN